MRVLYFHQHFSTRQGSNATRSFEFAQALLARGHRVTMVCGSFDAGDTGLRGPFHRGRRRGAVSSIDVIELALPYSNHDGFSRRIRTFARYAQRSVAIALREPCDLVLTSSPPLTAAIPGIVARLLRRKPLVFEARDLWPEFPRAMGIIRNRPLLAILNGLEWAAYRSADARIGLAPGIVAAMEARGGRAPTVLIPNGCDLELFATHDTTQATDLPPPRTTGLVAVYIGTHGPANGLDALLDAAALLRRRGRDDIELLLVGDGREKPRLQQRATREGLNNCRFREPIAKLEVPALLRSADVGLMLLAPVPAFAYATSPNKFFDYLATPLPVLANNPGWVADLIREHDCGRVVPARDPAALADALIALADQRGRLPAMARRAAALARNRFDRRQLAAAFVATLEAAVAKP